MSEIAPLISDLAVILIAAGIITLVFKLPDLPYLIYQQYPILPI